MLNTENMSSIDIATDDDVASIMTSPDLSVPMGNVVRSAASRATNPIDANIIGHMIVVLDKNSRSRGQTTDTTSSNPQVGPIDLNGRRVQSVNALCR